MWTGFDRCSSRGTDNLNQNTGISQQETLVVEAEHISTIAGSFVSIGTLSQCVNDGLYDTDHTDLNSEFDEAELRRELLRDKWKLLFDMFDPEGFGEIPVEDFVAALKSAEFLSQVPMNKRELLYERAMKVKVPNGPGYVTFQDFVNVALFDLRLSMRRVQDTLHNMPANHVRPLEFAVTFNGRIAGDLRKN